MILGCGVLCCAATGIAYIKQLPRHAYRFNIVIPFGHSKVLPVSLSLTIPPTAVDACPLQLE
jgi:hypothetical protein